MGKIKILDKSVVEQIAAGEVVDRPASIVKELLENALDAGATTIHVEIFGGGIEGIVVGDNGCGMDEGDAVLALQRHATSKIADLTDLEKLATYGFRGEALASIASVSRLELCTRMEGMPHGIRVLADGGEIRNVAPWGVPEGTRVVVRDLFFNVPARRKFLKSVQTEDAACLDVIAKIALARCDVAFQVKRSGKLVYALPAGESLKERYLKLFPQTPPSELFFLEAKRDFALLHGLVGGPLFAKSNRNSILFYVNKRSVRPGVFSQAVVDGYSGYLQAGKFPVVVLFLDIDGKWVDVNVHPTKAEVRFSHPKEVYGFIEKSLSVRLSEIQEEVRRHIPLNESQQEAESSLFEEETFPRFSQTQNVQTPPTESHSFSFHSHYLSKSERFEDLTLFEKLAPYEAKVEAPVLLGCVAKTYGLFQDADFTLFLVDLHGAHERINFDLLQNRFNENTRSAQQLLAPLALELSALQKHFLEKYESFFQEMGLEFEAFGERAVLLRSVPLGLERLGQKSFFLSLLERLEKVDELKDPNAIRQRILMTVACRSSVQAGDDLSNSEMQSLFEKLLHSTNPYFCPHGRPIIIKLTLNEVHKLFRRR
jgi:DNA mismatch repair protein MutL